MAFSLKNYWQKCFEADKRRAARPDNWPKHIPRNWDEWSLDALYWHFQKEAEKRRLADLEASKKASKHAAR